MKSTFLQFTSSLLCGSFLALGANAQSIATDKPSYELGETAIITAAGFQPNELVTFMVTVPNAITPSLETPWQAIANSQGDIVTTWAMNPAAPYGSEFQVTASNSAGFAANTIFSHALGQGRVSSVVPAGTGCVQQSLPPVTGTELWYVQEYQSYQVTLTNVTDCSGAATIEVIVNSQNTASQCVTATRLSPGVYRFITDMPPNACEGYGILYCTTGCSAGPSSTSARVARRSDGIAQQSRLRVATFGAGCTAPVQDNVCTCPAVTISCPNPITVCADAQSCSQVVYFNPQVSGGCPDLQVTTNPPSGSTFPIGTSTVVVTATDFFGTQQCSFTVTVNDCDAPSISCPTDITTCADSGACSAIVNFNVTGVDGCSTPVNVVCTPPSGSAFPVGTTTVSCSATDAAGNVSNCSFNVTVNDCENPTIQCPSNITQCADAGTCGAVVTFAVNGADNCAGFSVVSSPASGSVFPVGTTTVNSTVTDAAGNSAQCSFTVTVNDCESPTLSLPNPITVCNDAGACGAVVSFSATGNDNCPGVTVVSAPPSGSVFPIGTTVVNTTATDAAGNVTNGSFSVTVNDCEDPVATCPQSITTCNDAGQCGAVVTFSATGTDNCPGVSVVATPSSGSVFPVGTTTVNVVATDAAGRTSSCSFSVTVNDCEAPVASCPQSVTTCNDAGQCGAVVTFNASGSDNCSGSNTVATPASGSVFPIGTTTVTVVTTDASGNVDQCTFDVTVNDCESPTISVPNPITVCNDAGTCGAVVTFAVTGSDNCPGYTVNATPASGSVFPVGTTTVQCSVTDAAGNVTNGSFTVTVDDCEDPSVSCPSNLGAAAGITQCNDAGQCGAIVSFSTPANDNCPGVTVVATPASGSFFPVGTTTVNVVATDAAGRTATCSFNVTINDCEDPVASCPQSITACNDAGQCGAVVTFNASGSDNCSGSTTVATPASGSVFPIGTTTVTVVTTDAAGNFDQCTFDVTVNDCESPTISVPNPITVCNDAGSCGAVVTYAVTGSDNCPGYTVNATPASGSVFPIGTTTVQCSVTDAAGNVTNGSFTVTVNDCEDPVASCPQSISQCADAGTCGAVVTFSVGSSDNCPGSSAVATPASGSVFPIGTTVVNVVATDASGRTSSCSFSVTITDCEAPTVACPSNVTQCADSGACSAVVNFNVSGADNCGQPTVVASPASGSTFAVGTTTVVVTATDAAGNTQQCSFTVTVTDCEQPSVQCPSNIDVCNAPGQCSAIVNFVATGSDNCSGLTVTANPTSGSSFPVGTSTVVVTATDAAGNTQQCSFTVTVRDCEAPTIQCPPDFIETWVGQGPASGQTHPSRTGYATYSDNCGATLTYSDTFQPGMAPGEPETIVTRTWCATDATGQQACCIQKITLLSPGNHGGVFLDMSPGNCPNTVQVWTPGYARGSVLGSFQFDVSQIVPTSLRIKRADGIGRPLNPSLEIYQDNSTPYRGTQGGCNAFGADGSVDLTFRVLKDKMRRAFLLSNLPEGTQVPVLITGTLYNGAVFQTRDFIRVSQQL